MGMSADGGGVHDVGHGHDQDDGSFAGSAHRAGFTIAARRRCQMRSASRWITASSIDQFDFLVCDA
jgi:hypothetical protein